MWPLLLLGGALLALLALGGQKSPETPPPVPEGKPPPPEPKKEAPVTVPVPTKRAPPYSTAPEDIGDPVSWGKLGSDAQVATLFRDKKTGGFAHVSYRGALAAAKALGGTLLTREDMIALSDQARAAGLELDPVMLPGASKELTSEGARPGDPAMDSERWARIHDALLQAQLDALKASVKWDGKSPIANAGKVWIAGAPPGRAYLMGWRQKSGNWIQQGTTTGPGPHSDLHVDYSMLLTLRRPLTVA